MDILILYSPILFAYYQNMNPPRFVRDIASKYLDIVYVKKFVKYSGDNNRIPGPPRVGDIIKVEYSQRSNTLNNLLAWDEQLGSFDLIHKESVTMGKYFGLRNFRVNNINNVPIFDIAKDMNDYIYNEMYIKNIQFIEGPIADIDKILWRSLGYSTDIYRNNWISAYIENIEIGRNHVQIPTNGNEI
jgi:hypothetical protein